MRQRISDKNKFPSFSLKTEYDKLNALFHNREAFGRILVLSQRMRPSISYFDCIQNMFLKWELRGTFTTLDEMMEALAVSERNFVDSVTEERLLDYIQFLVNAVVFVDTEVNSGKYAIYQVDTVICDALVENCCYLLEHLGAEMCEVDRELVIVYGNDVASVVKEQHPDLSVSIVEYQKIDNRGDLQRKGEILCTLAKTLEPFENRFKGTEFNALCTDTTMLFNNIGARHALKSDDKVSFQFMTMKKEDLEKWYDNAFQMFLACMSVLPYLDVKGKLKTIKSGKE